MPIHKKIASRHISGNVRSPGIPVSSYASDTSHTVYPDIQIVSPCEVLWPYGGMDELVIATGQVWPTSERYIDDMEIFPTCVKVQVETVFSSYTGTPAPHNKAFMSDLILKFIAWPRKSVKVQNASSGEPYFSEMINQDEVPNYEQGTNNNFRSDDFLYNDDPLTKMMMDYHE